jgi:hypothetical protein
VKPLDVDGYYARLEREYEATLDDGRGEPCEVCDRVECVSPYECERAMREAEAEARADAYYDAQRRLT